MSDTLASAWLAVTRHPLRSALAMAGVASPVGRRPGRLRRLAPVMRVAVTPRPLVGRVSGLDGCPPHASALSAAEPGRRGPRPAQPTDGIWAPDPAEKAGGHPPPSARSGLRWIRRSTERGALLLVAGALALLPLSGCARRDAKPPAPSQPPPDITLPDWAPENPSPEFLRAARVLNPMVPELIESQIAEQLGSDALAARYCQHFPAAYELFGTLTDEEIQQLWSAGEVRLPVRSLNDGQRAALEEWLATWRGAMAGAAPEIEDFLVILYKAGAREDLSNVDVGFWIGGRVVHLTFWVERSGQEPYTSKLGFALHSLED